MLPILPIRIPPITDGRREQIRTLAKRYKRDERAFVTCQSFHPLVQQGMNAGCKLILAGQREVALFSGREARLIEYRMVALAGANDILVLHRRDADFEHYLSEYLGISGIYCIELPSLPSVCMATQLRQDSQLFSHICDIASKAGSLTLHAYLTTGNVWRLAQAIAEACERPVSVCGPSSRISRRVNDKLWFADCLKNLLGPDSIPSSFAAYGPAAAVGHVRRLARTSRRIVVKVPQSAGSMGNIAFDREQIEATDNAVLRQQMLDLLYSRGWRDAYPFLIGVWDCNVKSSPSVQMWIPDSDEGDPIIEGVFEQNVTGPSGTFIGASKAEITGETRACLIEDAQMIGFLFQQLGYFGRCSLDAIISVDGGGDCKVQWIECNGRWGGVSLPMTLAHRILPCDGAGGMVVMQPTGAEVNIHPLAETLSRLGDLLFRKGSSGKGIVLTSPPAPTGDPQMSMLALASEQIVAAEIAMQAIERLGSQP